MAESQLTTYHKQQYRKHASKKSRKWLQGCGYGWWCNKVDEEENKKSDDYTVLEILEKWRNL